MVALVFGKSVMISEAVCVALCASDKGGFSTGCDCFDSYISEDVKR